MSDQEEEGSAPLSDTDALLHTSFKDRLRMELRLENMYPTGTYPHTYGRLNYVLAFGSGGVPYMCGCGEGRHREFSQRDFVPITPWKWLVWRWFVCLYMLGVFLYSILSGYQHGVWFYYLSNWQITIFFLYGVSALSTCLLLRRYHWDELNTDLKQSNALLIERYESTELPLYVQITWLLHGLALAGGIMVTIAFWSMAPTSPEIKDAEWVGLSLLDHFSTTLVIIIDFYFCAFPWLLMQFVWTAIYIATYTFWTVLHYNMGLSNRDGEGNYVYEQIDWSKPWQTLALVVFGFLVPLPLLNALIWICSSEVMIQHRLWPKRRVPWIPMGSGGESLLDGDDVEQQE